MILGNFHTGGKENLRVVQKGTEGIKYELSFKGKNFTNSESGGESQKCSSKHSPLMSHLENATIGSVLIIHFHSKGASLNIFPYLIIWEVGTGVRE